MNCWFMVGSSLNRSGAAILVRVFAGELFVFERTDAQAAIRGVERRGMSLSRSPEASPGMRAPDKVIISLDRLELLHATMAQTAPLIGRVHYQVLANGVGPYCVRLDYEMGDRHISAFDYPQRPLWGNGALGISFPPTVPDAGAATVSKGR